MLKVIDGPAESTRLARRLVVRNGYHNEREVMTSSGAVAVRNQGERQACRFGNR